MSECVATIPATLKFTVKDCDPTTGEPDSEEGYSDDYQLEDIDLAVSDYVQRVMKVFAAHSLHCTKKSMSLRPRPCVSFVIFSICVSG